jgi:hypothetical protein
MIDASDHQIDPRKPVGSHLIDDIGLPTPDPNA